LCKKSENKLNFDAVKNRAQGAAKKFNRQQYLSELSDNGQQGRASLRKEKISFLRKA